MKLRTKLLLACAVLAGCGSEPSAITPLPPDQVLKNAAEAAQKLSSVQYLISGNFDLDSQANWTADGVIRMDGVMNDAGDKVRFQTDVTADVQDTQPYTLDASVELVVLDDADVYLNIHSLSSQPNNELFSSGLVRNMAGRWWVLPGADKAPGAVNVTPDPSLLRAQAEVIAVLKDNGLTTFAGVDAYHYDIALDKQKLLQYIEKLATERGEDFNRTDAESSVQDLQATGEIWLDATTFFVQKVVWNLASLSLSGNGVIDAELTITFRNHNKAPMIEPPTNATEFTPAVLFTLPSDALFNEEIPGLIEPQIPPQDFNSLLDTLNSIE